MALHFLQTEGQNSGAAVRAELNTLHTPGLHTLTHTAMLDMSTPDHVPPLFGPLQSTSNIPLLITNALILTCMNQWTHDWD